MRPGKKEESLRCFENCLQEEIKSTKKKKPLQIMCDQKVVLEVILLEHWLCMQGREGKLNSYESTKRQLTLTSIVSSTGECLSCCLKVFFRTDFVFSVKKTEHKISFSKWFI